MNAREATVANVALPVAVVRSRQLHQEGTQVTPAPPGKENSKSEFRLPRRSPSLAEAGSSKQLRQQVASPSATSSGPSGTRKAFGVAKCSARERFRSSRRETFGTAQSAEFRFDDFFHSLIRVCFRFRYSGSGFSGRRSSGFRICSPRRPIGLGGPTGPVCFHRRRS